MEHPQKDASNALPASGLLWVAIIAAGGFLFFHEVPWKGSRPVEPATATYRVGGDQNIDARLWQDPIDAVTRGRDGETRRAKNDPDLRNAIAASHSPEKLTSALCARGAGAKAQPLIIGAMVSGAAYPEYAETRRRARYAVLAALSESGFVPEDPEHIGYIVPQAKRRDGRPIDFVAFEWFYGPGADASYGTVVPESGSRAVSNGDAHPSRWGTGPSRVLLLWLDSDVFWPATHGKLVDLVKQLRPAPQCDPPPESTALVVLGPGDSRILRDLVRDPSVDLDPNTPNIVFYDYAATADATDILKPGTKETDRVFFKSKNMNVVVFRTIGTDAALAKTIVEELGRRGAVAPQSDARAADKSPHRHVVLISERDTLYGQTIPVQIAEKLSGCESSTAPCTMAQMRKRAPWIHTYSYLRGLDGQLPGNPSVSSSGSGGEDASPKAETANPGSRSNEAKRVERPEGESQLDYLRRLAERLTALQDDLRASGETISAIGVLGSDVYDKLLVLEALRPMFPHAIFFTTDLDARLLHPQELQWTRNLIVVSNFGLSLHPDLQGDIPPFRDSYQTSTFFASRVALVNAMHGGCEQASVTGRLDCLPVDQSKLKQWLDSPRTFEVGRRVAFDLSEGPAGVRRTRGQAWPPCELARGCTYVHAAPSPMYPTPNAKSLRIGFALLVVGGILLAVVTGRTQRAFEWMRGDDPYHWHAGRLLIAGAAALVILLIGIFIPHWWADLADRLTRDNGVPVTLLEGVSIWPSELLRLVAFALSVCFLVVGWRSLNRNADDIARTMLWQPERATLIQKTHELCAHWPWWKKVLRLFSFRLQPHETGKPTPGTGLTPDAEAFWISYIYQGRGWARFWRILAATVLYMAFGTAMSALFGFPDSPYRGAFAAKANFWVVMLSVILMLALIFFVVDATALCILLIGKLRRELPTADQEAPFLANGEGAQFRWPKNTMEHYAAKLHVDQRYVDQWIGMHFIARRTQAVANLVYYPFIVLSLMVFARSSLFDNWTMPTALIIVLGGSFLIVIGCAVTLRWSAEATRRKAIWRLANEIIGLKGGGAAGKDTAGQLEAMITQIRDFRRGAFAPYLQQPIVHALLLPLGSYGGGALIQYLTLSNF